MKNIKGKPKLSLLPYEAILRVVQVREFGNKKYNGDNYKSVDPVHFIDATLRHIFKHLNKQEIDLESGHLHLSHAATSLLLALDNYIGKNKLKEFNSTPYEEIYQKAYTIIDKGTEPDRFSMKEIIKAWEEDIKFQIDNEELKHIDKDEENLK